MSPKHELEMLLQLIEKARRRYLMNGLLKQGAWAMAAALAGLVLLLIAGTQIMEWYWLVAAPTVTLGAGIYWLLRRMPSNYGIAQVVDHAAGTEDSISTAYYFSLPAHLGRPPERVRDAQFAEAERLSGRISASQTIPFRMPRAIYAVAGLLVLAGGLVTLRYVLEKRLDLRLPLASVLRDTLGGAQPHVVAAQKPGAAKRPDFKDSMGMTVDAQNPQVTQNPENGMETINVPADEKDGGAQTQAQIRDERPGDQLSDGEQGEQIASGEEGNASSGDAAEQGEQGPSQGKQQANKAPGESGKQSNGGESSSLLSKLKDAMNNLMSKMKQQPQGNSQQQQSAAKQNGGQKQQSASQKGKSSEGEQGEGQQSESQEGEPGEQSQNQQNAQGKGPGQSSDQQAAKQPGSGIGKQDGDKDIRNAQQLAAMGKISEIIGKRSQNVTGEVTVEVKDSSQQIRTPVAQRNASHGESGGEISRDEVPVVYQPYVQQYFEQIRKQDAARK